jgi:3-isopropylmalate/(R)-2-methylmalate dehydratase large subunit
MAMANEFAAIGALREFERIPGVKRIRDPQKVVIVPDHFTPNKDIQTANLTKKVREFARAHDLPYYEVGRVGIEHVLLPEQGLVLPGQLVIAGDSHTCTYGGLGLLSTGVGSTDVAVAWALGKCWLKVPPSIRVVYRGSARPWVSGKDMMLALIGRLGVDGANYHALEFVGDAVEALSAEQRMTMANMAVECGAKNGIFAVDGKTKKYVESVTDKPYVIYASDPDAEYVKTIEMDMTDIEPQVAFPNLPSNTRPISKAGCVPIDQVLIGSCTNGRIEDLRVAAGLLKGRKIHRDVRCIVIPGSQKVYLDAIREGLIETFVESECAVSTPTCGPCVGGHMGILAAGERCVSTTNRNFTCRMGDVGSEIYLAGPAVAAASAICGRLADPAEVA